MPKQNNLILFGAYLGNRFGDNSGALYKYFIRHYNNKFRCIWLSNQAEAVSYVRGIGGEAYLKTSLRGLWFSVRTPLIITSHGTQDVLLYNPIFGKPKELYLHHGIPMRKAQLNNKKDSLHDSSLYIRQVRNITYMSATSYWGAEQQNKNIPVHSSKNRVTGYPRNDAFFQPIDSEINSLEQIYNLAQYNILYAPTWRKWGSACFFPFPDFDLGATASFLKKNNMSIILRPHSVDMHRQEKNKFWEDMQGYRDVIKAVTINEYRDTQMLMFLSDCLITDYSSIHYDYLLLNRPIIYLPYDIEEYVEKMGGFNCDYKEFTPGPKPKSQAEFLNYLGLFQKGIDYFSKERAKIRDIVHTYQDGQSCKRVYELVRETLMPFKRHKKNVY